jgi:hypothetical protein
MIPNTCVAIETKIFPLLEGEEDELVNEGMYGKALCKYLNNKLPLAGIEVPFFCCEDWGWWIEVKDNEFKMGLCVYSDPDAEKDPEKYAIISSITNGKKWSWSKFKKIDMTEKVLKIMDTVDKIFREDHEITSVTRHDDYPF